MRISSVLPFLSFLLWIGFLVPPAFAQLSGAIEISPLIMELEVENDTSYLREVTVRNKNAVDYEISFEAFDVEIDPENHNVKFLPPESKQNAPKSLAAWVTPEVATPFVLSPGQEATFRFRLSPPVGAARGDYYGSLNFYYKPLAQQRNGNITVRQSLGCLMLVSMNGEEELKPSQPYAIAKLVMNRKSQDTEVSVRFTNNTLRYAHLKPLITLKDASGEVYFQKEGRSKRVFPGEEADISHSFPNIYLAAENPLSMQFVLWDKQGKIKYYEEEVALDSLRMAPILPLNQYRIYLLAGAGVLLFCTLLLFRKRRLALSGKMLRKRR